MMSNVLLKDCLKQFVLPVADTSGSNISSRTIGNQKSKIKNAFTLIEAILALAIMGISSIALLSAVSRCLAVARVSRNYHTAVFVMDKAELEYPLIYTNEVFNNEQESTEFDEGFYFSRTIEEIEDEEDMFVVRTRVTWSMKGKDAFEEVATYLYSTNHP